MIRWHWYVSVYGGGTMPEFTTVSVTEAQLRTIPGRQGKFISEYADYIQRVTSGQGGKLHVLENENPLTIRRRLMQAAQVLDAKLVIKRSGQDVYFWKEDGAGEEPRIRRGRRRMRQDEPVTEETTALDQSFIEIE
jgi:hypothetical protein